MDKKINTFTIEQLEKIMITRGAVIRAIPMEVTHVLEKCHADRYPHSEILYLEEDAAGQGNTGPCWEVYASGKKEYREYRKVPYSCVFWFYCRDHPMPAGEWLSHYKNNQVSMTQAMRRQFRRLWLFHENKIFIDTQIQLY